LTQVLLVTPNRSRFGDISAAIQGLGGQIGWAPSGRRAMEIIRQQTVELVVTDEQLGDMTGLEMIAGLIAVDPAINCAAVSSLSDKAFHRVSEGLGILMKLPPAPSRADGKRLITRLNQIVGAAPKTPLSETR
jgi:DNA-binding NtrC family response regulator